MLGVSVYKTAAVLSILFLAACGDSTDPNGNGNGETFGMADLVGAWQATSFNGDTVPGSVTVLDGAGGGRQVLLNSFVIVLNEDSTGTWDFDFVGRLFPPSNFTWTITSGENFRITFSNGPVMTGQHDAGVLRMTDERGNTWVME